MMKRLLAVLVLAAAMIGACSGSSSSAPGASGPAVAPASMAPAGSGLPTLPASSGLPAASAQP